MITSAARLLAYLPPVLVVVSVAACQPESREPAGGRIDDAERTGVPHVTLSRIAEYGRDGSAEAVPLHRIAGIGILPEGRVVIANGGSLELLYLDANSQVEIIAGGRGRAPGEFQSMAWLQRSSDDRVIVYDNVLDRLSVFDQHGQYQYSVTPPQMSNQTRAIAISVVEDGSILSRARHSAVPSTAIGAYTDSILLVRIHPETEAVETLAVIANQERFVMHAQVGGQVQRLFYPQPFGHTALYAAGPRSIGIVHSKAFELHIVSLDGELDGHLRGSRTGNPVTAATIRQYEESMLDAASTPEGRRGIQSRIAQLPFPAHMPAIGALFADEHGRFWLGEYLPTFSTDERNWFITDGAAVIRAQARLPGTAKIWDVRRDLVALSMLADDTDEEYVTIIAYDTGAARFD